jgi:hypothetical protein
VANLVNASVELFYDAAQDYVTDVPNLTVVKDNGAGAWLNLTQASVSGSPSITSGSFSSFSYFTLGNAAPGTNPLPISLLYFKAEVKNEVAITNWITEFETNNDYFTVQRSEDGRNFTSIGKVDGAGDSYSERKYQFADEGFGQLKAKTVYYRLIQTDFDGQYSISSPVAVKKSMKELFLGPNPGSGVFYLVSENDISNIVVYNSSGQLIQLRNSVSGLSTITGSGKRFVIDISDYPAGLYFVFAYEGTDIIYSGKLIKE